MELLTEGAEAVLADLSRAYVACPGTPLYYAPCVMCGRPLRSDRFQIHVLITLEPRPDDAGHILAGAVVRHLDCDPDDDEDLYGAAVAALTRTRAG